MRITAFIGAALVCIGMLALAPVAMAAPAPDTCMLDMTPAADFAYDAAVAVPTCQPAILAVQTFAALSPSGDEDEAAGPCAALQLKPLDFAGARLHFDPGRCLS